MSPYECMTFLFKCWKGRKLNGEDISVVACKFATDIGNESLAPYALLSYMGLDDLKEFDKYANSHGETPDFKRCVEEIVKKEKLPTWQSRVEVLAKAKNTNDWLFRAALVLLARDLNDYDKLLKSDDSRNKIKEFNSVTEDVEESISHEEAESVMSSVFGEDTKINETFEEKSEKTNQKDAENDVSKTLQSALTGIMDIPKGSSYSDYVPKPAHKKSKVLDTVSALGDLLDAAEKERKQQEEVIKEYGDDFDFDFADSTINIPVKRKGNNKTMDALSEYLSKLKDNNKAYRLVKTGVNEEDFVLTSTPENYVNTGIIIGIRVENPYEQGHYLFMKGYLYKHMYYNKWGVMLNKNTAYYKGEGNVSNARAKCINEAVGDYTIEDSGVAFTKERFFFFGLSRIMAYMWGFNRSDDLSFWEVNSVDTKYVKIKDSRLLNAPLRKILDNGLDAYVEPIK